MLKSLVDMIAGAHCRICGRPLMLDEEYLCRGCVAELPRTGYHTRSANPMDSRFAVRLPIDRISGHFFYQPGTPMASMIHDMKYRGNPGLARHLGRLMAEELMASGWFSGIDYVCPVPLHWWKYLKREYNQSEEIARGICEATGIPLTLGLRARRHHRTQTGYSHARRRANVAGLFRLRDPGLYAGKTMLLVDDVCTTGSTLISAAEAIHEARPDSTLAILTLSVTV